MGTTFAGVTFKQLLLTHGGGFGDERNLKIGRSPPLSSNKSATHFPQVQGVVDSFFVVISKLAFSMTAVHLLIALIIVGVILNLLFAKKEVNS